MEASATAVGCNPESHDNFEQHGFVSIRWRTMIPLLPPLLDERRKALVEEIIKDKHYAIDACIVRVTKSSPPSTTSFGVC